MGRDVDGGIGRGLGLTQAADVATVNRCPEARMRPASITPSPRALMMTSQARTPAIASPSARLSNSSGSRCPALSANSSARKNRVYSSACELTFSFL